MPLANDLKAQAYFLARHEPRKPKQASLKRAISAAYYALFHLLLDDAMLAIAPPKAGELRNIARRAISHADMMAVCKAVQSRGTVSRSMSQPLAPELILVAEIFANMQTFRHAADYDVTETFSRAQTLGYIKEVDRAFLAWSAIRASPNAQIFLFAMFLGKRWGRV